MGTAPTPSLIVFLECVAESSAAERGGAVCEVDEMGADVEALDGVGTESQQRPCVTVKSRIPFPRRHPLLY